MESSQPNIIIILNDDMGYSDLGCYGGEIQSPNLDYLAENGLKFTEFYNTARCAPSRASLLTGLHPHQTGIGILVSDDRPEGYTGTLNRNCVTIAEVLQEKGYRTYMSGKWHLCHEIRKPNDAWPNKRGFDHFYGIITGATPYYWPRTLVRDNQNIEKEAKMNPDFYLTDAITNNAIQYLLDHFKSYKNSPFFLYVAYTAPHWPLHAKDKDVQKYRGQFDSGWDKLRQERLKQMIKKGIIHPDWLLTPRDSGEKPWEDVIHKDWEARRMEVYAAQIDAMDQGIGKILDTLQEHNQLNNTFILFLSDNGGCAEEILSYYRVGAQLGVFPEGRPRTKYNKRVKFGNITRNIPGPEDTYMSYGRAWANLSNTPFRLYKHWTHEGGIATPFIVHYPDGIPFKGELRAQPAFLPDIMATILDLTGASYPISYHGNEIYPLEGVSLIPVFNEKSLGERKLFFEHEGNAAVRDGKWKLVRNYPGDWELYNMMDDRTELHNIIQEHPQKANELIRAYETWAKRVRVFPRKHKFIASYGKFIGSIVYNMQRRRKLKKIQSDMKIFEQYWKSHK